jgi:hypothetical protein
MPEDQNKSQKFYEFILVDYGSVILSHTPCKFDTEHKRIAFSKCIIKNVAQWIYNSWQGKQISSSPSLVEAVKARSKIPIRIQRWIFSIIHSLSL